MLSRYSSILKSFLYLLLFTFFISSCGGGEKSEKTTETVKKDLHLSYEMVSVPPGALPDVPPELGGEGFTGEGWQCNFDYEPTSDPRAKKGGSFTWALYEFPATLRTLGKDSNSQLLFIIDNLVYEGMIGNHTLTMKFVPSLATHWKVSEDKRTFSFRLNPNARFADGSRLTSEDVIASWKLRIDKGILAPYSNMLWEKFEEPIAVSPYIVSVKSRELNWRFFIYFGGMNIMPAKYIGSLLFYLIDFPDIGALAVKLRDAKDPVSQFIHDELSEETIALLNNPSMDFLSSDSVKRVILDELNVIIQGENIYDEQRFAGIELSQEIKDLMKKVEEGVSGDMEEEIENDMTLVRLNKYLLRAAYPSEIAKAVHPEVITGKGYMKKYQYRMPPGSGPYELEHHTIIKDKQMTLRRRWDYWDEANPKGVGSANFEKLKFVIVNDERLMFEKFKKGEMDAYQIGRAQWWVEETNFENIRRGLVQKRKIYNDDPQGTSGLVFNMREEPFKDIRVRQAFVHLFNREKMIDQLFFNEYDFIDSYYPGGTYENPDNPKYRYDPDRAIQLLKEAGWSERNSEGWLVNSNGNVFELEMSYASRGSARFLTVFQEDLQKVGIKLELKQSTGPTMFKMVNERKFKIHWQAWGGLFFPNPENVWTSRIADPDNTNNLAGVKNERIDELCKEYNVCFDTDRRVEIIREIDGILMEIQPYALAWYAPFHRILYWNKFGHPDYYFARTSDWRSILTLWWYDEEKIKKLEEAKKDNSIQLEVGETEMLYWPEYNAEHGRKYNIEGL